MAVSISFMILAIFTFIGLIIVVLFFCLGSFNTNSDNQGDYFDNDSSSFYDDDFDFDND